MGLFLDNHENYKDYKERTGGTNAQFGSYTINNGRPDYAAWGIQLGTSSLFSIMDKIGEGKGGSDDKDLDEATKKKIETKEQELSSVYSEAGVSSYKELNKSITTQSNIVDKLQGEYQSIITQIQNLENLPADLQGEGVDANIEELQKQAQQKEEELRQAQVEQVRLTALLGKADNIKLEIKQLEQKSTGVSYDVEKETADIKKFMDALNEFKSNPSKESATKLKNIYEKGAEEGGNNGVDTKSIQDAWKLIKDKVDEYANGKKVNSLKAA